MDDKKTAFQPIDENESVPDADKTISILETEEQKDVESFEPIKGTNYIQDVSVFSQSPYEAQTAADELQADKKEGEQYAKPIYIALAIAIGCLLAAALTYWGFSIGARWAGRGRETTQDQRNPVNNASFIYLHDQNEVTSGSIVKKYAYGPLSTVFYFESDELSQTYEIALTDQNGVVYGRDLAVTADAGTVIFRPFRSDAESFTITLTNKLTGQISSKSYELKKSTDEIPSKYLSRPIQIFKTPRYAKGSAVVSGVFSNTGISLQCRFQWATDQETLPGDDVKIFLSDGAYRLMAKGASDIRVADSRASGADYSDGHMQADLKGVIFTDENFMLARMDFEPSRSLLDRLVLTIRGVNKTVELNQRMETENLFAYAEKGPQRLAIDDAVIVLEGMERKGAYLVLVLHGEKPNSSVRYAVDVDAELLAKDIPGEDIKIPGQCFTGHIGSDVLFPIGMQSDIRLSPETIRLNIKKIKLCDMEIDIPLELASFGSEPNYERQKVQSDLENAFALRHHDTSISAQVSMLSIEGSAAYACVLESLGDTVCAHRVTATLSDGNWVIESDEEI